MQMEMELTKALDAALADDSDEGVFAVGGIGPAAHAMLRQRRDDKRDMRRTAKQWLQHQGAPQAAHGSDEGAAGAGALNGAAARGVRPGKRPQGAAAAPGDSGPVQRKKRGTALEPADGAEEKLAGLLNGHLARVPGLGAWDSDDDMPSLPGLPSRPHSSFSSRQCNQEPGEALGTGSGSIRAGSSAVTDAANGCTKVSAAIAEHTSSQVSDAAAPLAAEAGTNKTQKHSQLGGRIAEEEGAGGDDTLLQRKGAQKRGKGRPPKPQAVKGAVTQKVHSRSSKVTAAREQGAAAAGQAGPAAGSSRRQAAVSAPAAAGLPEVDIAQMMADIADLEAIADAALAEDSDT